MKTTKRSIAYLEGFDDGQADVRRALEPEVRRLRTENVILRVDLKTERKFGRLEMLIALLRAADCEGQCRPQPLPTSPATGATNGLKRAPDSHEEGR